MIGYPDKWRSYDGLQVRQRRRLRQFRPRRRSIDHDRRLARIDSPVDRGEWWMMPITANAYASFANNQIVFPAAYLQPPHFDAFADPAVNYGAIGYVIGHEISHHFDDQGSKFDPEGGSTNGGPTRTSPRSTSATAKLVAQYDGYEALPGLNIRGAQTLGENIADNAGLAIAYDAYQLSLDGRPAPVIDGYHRRSALLHGPGAGQPGRVPRGRASPRDRSPASIRRASGGTWAVRNHDAWYEAFSVRPGHALYLPPEQRVRILVAA